MKASGVRWSDPIFQPQRKLKVICIGAGASGLLLAYKVQRHFDNFDLVVYEKNEDVSGTWFENKYPGLVLLLHRLLTTTDFRIDVHVTFPATTTPGPSNPKQIGPELMQHPEKSLTTSSNLASDMD